jgi:hypothetical protein
MDTDCKILTHSGILIPIHTHKVSEYYLNHRGFRNFPYVQSKALDPVNRHSNRPFCSPLNDLNRRVEQL